VHNITLPCPILGPYKSWGPKIYLVLMVEKTCFRIRDLVFFAKSEKSSFEFDETQVWDFRANIMVLVSTHLGLYDAILWAGDPQPSMS
jgi:hypothetical protein